MLSEPAIADRNSLGNKEKDSRQERPGAGIGLMRPCRNCIACYGTSIRTIKPQRSMVVPGQKSKRPIDWISGIQWNSKGVDL